MGKLFKVCSTRKLKNLIHSVPSVKDIVVLKHLIFLNQLRIFFRQITTHLIPVALCIAHRIYSDHRQSFLQLKQELAVSGSDLIAIGIKPGKEIGEILNRLLEMVIEDPELNQKEILLKKATI